MDAKEYQTISLSNDVDNTSIDDKQDMPQGVLFPPSFCFKRIWRRRL